MALVPLVHSEWVIFLSALFYGGAFGILRTSVQVLVLNNAPEDLRATFAAANGLTLRLAQTTAPVAAGFFLAHAGFTAFYITAALISLAMAALSLGAKSLRPEETEGG
jgi:MFS family permease